MDDAITALSVAAAVTCGLMGGAYYVFSVMIMPALRRLPAAQGIAAMQSINIAAITPMFMLALFIPAVLSVALIVAAITGAGEAEPAWLIAGGALYLAGSIGVTVAFNVPRNNVLAPLAAAAPGSERLWAAYVREWSAGNHARAIASLAASASFTAALL